MKLKWQWFVGGKAMFWTAIIMMSILFFVFTISYIIDPTTTSCMRVQDADTTPIKEISENYLKKLRN